MAESTLSLTWNQIQAKLGSFAGWGQGGKNGDSDPAWSSRQQAIIDDATQSGLRRFYYPAGIERPDGTFEPPYEWSFLYPTATLTLNIAQQEIALPDDFGGFSGQITCLSSPQVAQPWKIEWTNQSRLRQMYSVTPQMTGPPMYVAMDPIKGTSGLAGQRWQLLVFPAADQVYSLQGTYFINPDYLTQAKPYAYGGPEHIETILESCLAVMEERLDDQSGVHAAAYQSRLLASIAMDRKKKPMKFGPNIDKSDGNRWDRGDVHYWSPAATYGGQPFG